MGRSKQSTSGLARGGSDGEKLDEFCKTPDREIGTCAGRGRCATALLVVSSIDVDRADAQGFGRRDVVETRVRNVQEFGFWDSQLRERVVEDLRGWLVGLRIFGSDDAVELSSQAFLRRGEEVPRCRWKSAGSTAHDLD